MNPASLKTAIDFNSLLRIANLVSAGLILYGWTQIADNPYIDSTSMLLGLALCLQTEAALWVERRHRDPFVILLATWMIVFYQLRMFSLALLPVSAVFDRFEYDAADSNYAMTYILAANFALYLGLAFARARRDAAIDIAEWRPFAPSRVAFVLCLTLALTYLTGQYWSEGNVPRGINFLVLYFSPTVLVLMALLYFVLFRRSLGRVFALTLGGLIALELIAHTLLGSRGALVAFAQTCLIVLLAVNGSIQLSRRFVVVGVTLLPLIAMLMVGAFFVSSYIRTFRMIDGAELGVGIEVARSSQERLENSGATDILLGAVASRVGYFDFAAEIIAHREQYESVLNFGTYGRSLIDNLLTPGFDLYDQPRVSNSLLFIYYGLGTPSKRLAAENYQSDQFGIYGEAYALFGWGSLPVMFFIGFLFKRMFEAARSQNPFTLAMLRVIVLFAFWRLLDSFGVDWLIIDTLPVIAAVFIYRFFFSARRRRAGAGPSRPAIAGPAP